MVTMYLPTILFYCSVDYFYFMLVIFSNYFVFIIRAIPVSFIILKTAYLWWRTNGLSQNTAS